MNRWQLLLCLALIAPSPACSFSMAWDGMAVSERDGRVFVDDVPVDFHQEMPVQGDLDPAIPLVLTTASGLIDVVGVESDTYELMVDVFSEFEGDGSVVIEEGRLRARSDKGGKVLVNGIRGRLPQGLSIEVRSGTGEVVLTSFTGDGSLRVDTGTGDVRLMSCALKEIEVDSATGSIRVAETSADDFDVRSGTGVVEVKDCDFRRLSADTGTSDLRLTDSRVSHAWFKSATGDCVLNESVVSELSTTLGAGSVVRPEAD